MKQSALAPRQSFGGDWTILKLECLQRYLERYLQVLKNQRFQKVYIDAFAGTGYVDVCAQDIDAPPSLFDESEQAMESVIAGSAQIALELDPGFDQYEFIEKSASRTRELERLAGRYSDKRIQIYKDDANRVLSDMCSNWPSSTRGVLFLDPFGLSVEWDTVVGIANTRSIDMWYLFPYMGVSRLLPRDRDKITHPHRALLNRFFGTDAWEESFYQKQKQHTLFDEFEEINRSVSVDSVSSFLVSRLKTVFAGVAAKPKVLVSSTNTPLFLLCFAVGNTRGAPIAKRIAEHILTN